MQFCSDRENSVYFLHFFKAYLTTECRSVSDYQNIFFIMHFTRLAILKKCRLFLCARVEDTKNKTVSKREVKANKTFIVKYVNIFVRAFYLVLLINFLFLLIFVSFFERRSFCNKLKYIRQENREIHCC